MDENELLEATVDEVEPASPEEPSHVADELPCPDLTPSEDGQDNIGDSATDFEGDRAALEARIASLEAQLAERDRRLAEREEFCRIFPDADPDDLPEEVTSVASSGVPLAAAYALHRHLRQLELEKAKQDNHRNSRNIPHAIDGNGSEPFFSADTVRSMSHEEVKNNFSDILNSMKHWN